MEISTANTIRQRRKVGNACQRCRRQKLKCDIQRPCLLCVRAGVNCEAPPSDGWRPYRHGPSQRRSTDQSSRRRDRTDTSDNMVLEHHSPHNVTCAEVNNASIPITSVGENEGQSTISTDQAWNSSSTMSLVDGAFQLHNSSTPGTVITDAFPGGQRQELSAEEHESLPVRTGDPSVSTTIELPRTPAPTPIYPLSQISRSVMRELALLLPDRQAAELLVDTYFDRVHWFMLIFHQDDFRKRWPQLYERPIERITEDWQETGFASTFLMVIAIGLQYAGPYRRRLLEIRGIELESLKTDILSTIRGRLLDIVSFGSLDAVQTCILLGTYYLYHGNPSLAWPVCGCGLRTAQALNLHRRQHFGVDGVAGSRPSEVRRHLETRKRCWWAIYEIETFCSMSYGYPHSIKDEDCDVEPLDPLAKGCSIPSSMSSDQHRQSQTSLLSYKYFMAKLSVLTKTILTELYGIGKDRARNQEVLPNSPNHLQDLLRTATSLNERLLQWKCNIPSKLQLRDSDLPSSDYSSVDEMDKDIGASGPRFEGHIYQLQALALELAFENARILVHRPLLSYRMVSRSGDSELGSSSLRPISNAIDPFCVPMQACREAALSTSEIGSRPTFPLASCTYAAAFISIHAFTAGVTLCILSSIEPLTFGSYKSKLGLRRLMGMQTILRSSSTLATQGLEILHRLSRLVVERELNELLNISRLRVEQERMSNADGPACQIPPGRLADEFNISTDVNGSGGHPVSSDAR